MKKKVVIKTREYLDSERQFLLQRKKLTSDSFYQIRLNRVDDLIYRLGKHNFTFTITYDERDDLLSCVEEKVYTQHPYTIFEQLKRKER